MNKDIIQKKIFLFMLSALLTMALGACRDDIWDAGRDCPEGEHATVTVRIDLGDMTAVTRGEMQEGLDRRVTDLWVAVYNVSSGERTGETVVRCDDSDAEHQLREISLEALSGMSYIVGVANFGNRFGSTGDEGALVPLSDALSSADTWEKYCALAAAFDADGNAFIDTPLNPLVMSGTFTSAGHSDGSRTDNEPVAVMPGMSKPSGALHLRRLISQVKFNITYNKSNISQFAIKSWQVVNLPNQSWLLEREDTGPGINVSDVRTPGDKSYVTGEVMHEMTQSGSTYSFDFWQLENKRTGLLPPADLENPYLYREKEYKDAAGINTGRFSSLVASADADDPNNNATYVVFDVEMLMSVDENGRPVSQSGIEMRRVETRYVVHLGYVEGTGSAKARDFNCRRNSKYTYNVTINNVNDVLVEARNDNERNPGVEGVVSDVLSEHFQVDAHYSCMNIYLTRTELDNFEYLVLAYDLQGNEVRLDSHDFATVPADRKMYMEWVELRPTTGENVLAEYKPRTGRNSDGKTYLLSDLKDRTDLSAGWYTMFINEYVYESVADGNESGSRNWRGYVNRPDRQAWLYVLTETSPDGQSQYYKSKYAVSQKSIQTYYKTSSESGLGVEHVNESLGLNLRNSYNSGGGGNTQSGRYNLAYYLAGNSSWSSEAFTWRDDRYDWSTYLWPKQIQQVHKINNQGISRDARTEPLPRIRTVRGTATEYDPDRGNSPYFIEAITACLNRNRDLDGDGKIDASEIRWFVPTRNQYVRVILGRRSLVTPVVDVESVSKLPYTVNDYNSSLLYYTAEGRQIWAMEGTSDSKWCEWGGGAPWEVRCVRNLGGDMSVINTTNVTESAFKLRPGTTNIVEMVHYDSKSVRQEAYYSSSSPMPVHHIYDQRYNRCYKAFEVADPKYDIYCTAMEGLNLNSYDWADYLSRNNVCSSLVEKTGKDGWRVPNQKELTIMSILGLSSTYTYNYSCSVSYFDKSGYAYGANPSDIPGSLGVLHRYVMKVTGGGSATQGGDGSKDFGVRCVRDYVE